ncbi:MAG: AraC family transcriptional regulator [Clostridiales bacterium]|nr:AraC family transcriptional regulator [Clostridiales bacterium]
MKINKIQLEYAARSDFASPLYDGVRHTKVLPYLSVVQAVVGNYDIQLNNGKTYNTGDGGFFIAPSDVRQDIVHNADKERNIMVCRWVFLKIRLNNLYCIDDVYSFPEIIPGEHREEMNLLFNRLFAAEDIFDEYVCYYEIIRLLFRMAKEKDRKLSGYVDGALEYIKNNYRQKITVRDIAREVNLSESHLFSVFKKETGFSPITYLNNYRLSAAADLLLRDNKTIVEIADEVGICDSVYFNKLFRKNYQMAPSKYRETHGNGGGQKGI